MYNEFARLRESYGERKLIGLDQESKHWNGGIKLSSDPSKSVRLLAQTILSYRDFREHDQKWTLNKDNLPRQGKRSIRYHLELIHTINSDLYYNLKIGRLHLMRQVFGKDMSIFWMMVPL